MINKHELRIGSVIQDMFSPGTMRVVTELLSNGVRSAYFGTQSFYDYDSVDPILLTPEILLKCGFENVIEFDYHFRNGDFDIMIESHGIYYYIDDRGDNEGTKPRQIEHLHQLQNLYFALTNQELEINL